MSRTVIKCNIETCKHNGNGECVLEEVTIHFWSYPFAPVCASFDSSEEKVKAEGSP